MLVDLLGCEMAPVAISFADKPPKGARMFPEGKRGCVASMLLSVSRTGIVAAFDEHTTGCPGGGIGLCFPDSFEKASRPMDRFLSTGKGGSATPEHPGDPAEVGERFFANPAAARRWMDGLPRVDTGKPYIVFRRLDQVPKGGGEPPDLVCLFANPDQLSALVVMSGFARGTALNAVAPFGAACQSILYAAAEADKDEPRAIIGFMDIAQRHLIPRDLLTFTVPFAMFCEMDAASPEGPFATTAWHRIAGR